MPIIKTAENIRLIGRGIVIEIEHTLLEIVPLPCHEWHGFPPREENA